MALIPVSIELSTEEKYADNLYKKGVISKSRISSGFDLAAESIKEKYAHNLDEKDITELLRTQKEYQNYGCCYGHCPCILSYLSKIKYLIFNVILCTIGLITSFLIKRINSELSQRIFFYTIYCSFLILCISITRLLIIFVMMPPLIRCTKNSWKVFYIKGIRDRLYLAVLACLWFAGFYGFGEYIHYDYNPKIFSAIKCILITSMVFLLTHLSVRYVALHSYFEIFKIQARKLKAYVIMIEIMADKQTSGLFSIPLMNFLIDFPSTKEIGRAKKERRKNVSFRLNKEEDKMIKKIAKSIKKDMNKPKKQKNNNNNKDNKDGDRKEEDKHKNKNSNDEEEEVKHQNNEQSLSEWLFVDVIHANDGKHIAKNIVDSLKKLKVESKDDLKELLTDLNSNQYDWINKIKDDILSGQEMRYQHWIKFRQEAPKLLNKNDNESGSNDDENKQNNTDIDEEDEIKNLKYDLYSVNLSNNMRSIQIISDEDLDKLTRVLSFLIFIRLRKFKQTKIQNALDLQDILDLWEDASHPAFNKEHELNKITNKLKVDKNAPHDQRAQYVNNDADYDALRQIDDDDEDGDNDDNVDNVDDYYDTNIYKDDLIAMFIAQGGNDVMEARLAWYAWKRFAPKLGEQVYANETDDIDTIYEETKETKEKEKKEKEEEKEKFVNEKMIYLDTTTLNVHIYKIFRDILLLKQSIDSYTIIILNLQRMVDVITPILLLFVYLYIFNFDFQQSLGLYVSSVGIIGFFGSSYFSSVFASISFIIALNPFLVGDWIKYKGEIYEVKEISLVSCTFRHRKTGDLYTFQNKMLGTAKEPIVNITRSEGRKLNYRWTLYFKHNVRNYQLKKFKERSKELIEKDKGMNEDHQSIRLFVNSIDELQRKKVIIQMTYNYWSPSTWDKVRESNNKCFNYFTQAMDELNLQYEPLQQNLNGHLNGHLKITQQ